MRSPGFLGLMVLTGCLAATPLYAEDDPPACEVPAYLLSTESPLPKVADAFKSGRALNILVVGSRSSTINASEASAYPARLQALLKKAYFGYLADRHRRCYPIDRSRRFSPRCRRRCCCVANGGSRRGLDESAI